MAGSSVWAPMVRRSTAARPPTTMPVAAAVKQPASPALMPIMAAARAARTNAWFFISLPGVWARRETAYRLDRAAQAMGEQQVDFLDPAGTLVRDPQLDIVGSERRGEAAAVAPREREHAHAAAMGGLDGAQDAGGIPAGADRDEHVALASEAAHLAREDFVVCVVVGDRGEDGRVGGECDGRQRLAFALEAPDELGGQMLAVRGGAAVAADEDLAAAREARIEQPRSPLRRLDQHGASRRLGVQAFGEMRVDAGGWRHRPGLYGPRSVERIAKPVDATVLDRAYVETAGGPRPVAEAALEQVLRLQADAALLGRRHARGGAPERGARTPAHLDAHPLRAVEHDDVDLAEGARIVAGEETKTRALEMTQGERLRLVAAPLRGRASRPRLRAAHRAGPEGAAGTGTKPGAGGAGGTGTNPPLPDDGAGVKPEGAGGCAGTGTKPDEDAGAGARPGGAGIGARPPGAGAGAGTGTKPGEGAGVGAGGAPGDQGCGGAVGSAGKAGCEGSPGTAGAGSAGTGTGMGAGTSRPPW